MHKSPFHYVLPEKEERMHLVVSRKMHTLVRIFAKKHDITMTEATWRLLRIAFCEVYDLPKED